MPRRAGRCRSSASRSGSRRPTRRRSRSRSSARRAPRSRSSPTAAPARDFGSGKGCTGIVTVLDSDMRHEPDRLRPGAVHRQPVPPGREPGVALRRGGAGQVDTAGHELRPARARSSCLTLDISRAVPETLRGHAGAVTRVGQLHRAELLLREAPPEDRALRPDGRRRAAPEARLPGLRPDAARRRSACATSTAASPRCSSTCTRGGAHCCSITLILRWDAGCTPVPLEARLLGQLRHDASPTSTTTGCPSSSAYDERFIYTYTAYVFSAAPPQIFDYRQGKLVDVTRKFPRRDREERGLRAQAVRPAEEGRRTTSTRARSSPSTSPTSTCSAGPTRRRRRSTTRSRKGVLYTGKAYLGYARRQALRRTAEQGPAQVGLHPFLSGTSTRYSPTPAPGSTRLTPERGARGLAGRRAARRHALARRAASSSGASIPGACTTRSRSCSGGSTSCRARRA